MLKTLIFNNNLAKPLTHKYLIKPVWTDGLQLKGSKLEPAIYTFFLKCIFLYFLVKNNFVYILVQ